MEDFNYESIGIYYCRGCDTEFEFPTTEQVIECDNCNCNMYLTQIIENKE